jgi:hypothetical protein
MAEPPRFMQRQFFRDVQVVIEAQLAVLAPEKTIAHPPADDDENLKIGH